MQNNSIIYKKKPTKIFCMHLNQGFKWSKTDLTWKLHNYWAEGKLDNNTQL